MHVASFPHAGEGTYDDGADDRCTLLMSSKVAVSAPAYQLDRLEETATSCERDPPANAPGAAADADNFAGATLRLLGRVVDGLVGTTLGVSADSRA